MYYLRKRIFHVVKRMLGRPVYPRRYDELYAEIRRMGPCRILEIGTNDGLNARRMVAAAASSCPDVRYYGMDLFEHQTDEAYGREFSLRTRSSDEVRAYLEQHGVRAPVLIAGDSTVLVRERRAELGDMDVIFIDGGHSYETVKSDWEGAQSLLSSRAVVFFDDYPNWGVGPVVDAIDRTMWDVRILPVKDRFRALEGFEDGSSNGFLEFQLARVERRR